MFPFIIFLHLHSFEISIINLQYQDEKFVEFILLNRDIHQNIQIMIKILGL